MKKQQVQSQGLRGLSSERRKPLCRWALSLHECWGYFGGTAHKNWNRVIKSHGVLSNVLTIREVKKLIEIKEGLLLTSLIISNHLSSQTPSWEALKIVLAIREVKKLIEIKEGLLLTSLIISNHLSSQTPSWEALKIERGSLSHYYYLDKNIAFSWDFMVSTHMRKRLQDTFSQNSTKGFHWWMPLKC